ncbi:hypothetical protein F2Q68_00005531 [Brassica cretica]|uniref:Uncharacterized protein n=1 Tax=Brassica cretica TaxID=69181 RepID=A0A8S9JES2_BRACR|nr:hypothetical protein F2Q68_00005531 [Brassica cretica]
MAEWLHDGVVTGSDPNVALGKDDRILDVGRHSTGWKALGLDLTKNAKSRSSLTRHVALPDHGVGLDSQSCSCFIGGWPVGLSSPTPWDENLKVKGVRSQTQTQSERGETDSEEFDSGMDWTNGEEQDFVGKRLHQIKQDDNSVIIPVMRYEDNCGGLEEDIQETVVDSVKIYGDEWRMSYKGVGRVDGELGKATSQLDQLVYEFIQLV